MTRPTSTRAGYEVPLFEVVEPIRAMLQPGEKWLDGARRIMVNGALAKFHGDMTEAAAYLGEDPHTFRKMCARYKLRPSDRVRGVA